MQSKGPRKCHSHLCHDFVNVCRLVSLGVAALQAPWYKITKISAAAVRLSSYRKWSNYLFFNSKTSAIATKWGDLWGWRDSLCGGRGWGDWRTARCFPQKSRSQGQDGGCHFPGIYRESQALGNFPFCTHSASIEIASWHPFPKNSQTYATSALLHYLTLLGKGRRDLVLQMSATALGVVTAERHSGSVGMSLLRMYQAEGAPLTVFLLRSSTKEPVL